MIRITINGEGYSNSVIMSNKASIAFLRAIKRERKRKYKKLVGVSPYNSRKKRYLITPQPKIEIIITHDV